MANMTSNLAGCGQTRLGVVWMGWNRSQSEVGVVSGAVGVVSV